MDPGHPTQDAACRCSSGDGGYGSGFYADQGFALLPAVAALPVALLLQIEVNLAHDYFDFKKGIDSQ